MSGQIELFTIQPAKIEIPKKIELPPAIQEILATDGYYMHGRRMVRACVAEWRKEPPDYPGYWLSWDGRTALVHHCSRLASGLLHLTGKSELVAGLGLTRSLGRLGLLWFGPCPDPPDIDAHKQQPSPREKRWM